MSELYYAEMEAARNEAEDAYFKARPQIEFTGLHRTLFRVGFERAFQLLWNQRAADSIDVVAASDYDAIAARLAEEIENAATYKQERDEIVVNYETVAAQLTEAHRQNADLMAIIDKRDEALGFIPLDKGMDMMDELREAKARLAEAERLLNLVMGRMPDRCAELLMCEVADFLRATDSAPAQESENHG